MKLFPYKSERILLVALLMICGCKKKHVTPEPEPEPMPTCQTGLVLLSGKYVSGGDTLEFIFDHNNCPHENSNWYLVKGLAKVSTKRGDTLNADLQLYSDEKKPVALTKDLRYICQLIGKDSLTLMNNKFNPRTILLIRKK